MAYSYISSKDVLAFLPLDTWTEVILTSSDNGVYIATTEEKEIKRKEDQVLLQMLQNKDILQKIKEYKPLEIVAVEFNGEWYRGRLVSYNEFQDDDTRMELIDVGLVHLTKLSNVFTVPGYFLYEPLVLPIKFRNFIPNTKKLKIRPLLSESLLNEGVVLVDVDLGSINIQQEKKVESKKDFKFDCESSITSINNRTNANGFANGSGINLSNGSNNFLVQKKQLDKCLPFKNGDYCIITYFDSVNSVYVVKASKSETDNSYNYCNSNIVSKTANSSTDKLPIYHMEEVEVGEMVKVFSSQKKCFCRATVLRHVYPRYLIVQLVDFGNKEKVLVDDIYIIADELLKPGFAVKIGICDNTLKNYQNNEKIKDMFAKFIEEKKVFVIEFNEQAANCLESVMLKDENGSYINYDDYLKKNCLSIEDTTSITKTPELNQVNDTGNIPKSLINSDEPIINGHEVINSIKSNSSTVCSASFIGNSKSVDNNKLNNSQKCSINDFQSVTLKNGDCCLISFFENFDNIYVCKAVKNDKNEFVAHNLHIIEETSISKDCTIKTNPVIGDIVKVLSPEFDIFFRAIVLSIENDSFLVSYIDYGNTENVQSNNIFELPNELIVKETKLPACVSMKVPSNSKVTSEIKNYFFDITVKVLCIEFDDKSAADGLKNVIFKELVSAKSVNNEILQFLPTEKILIKNGDSCIVTHCDDVDSIYVSKGHLIENDLFLNKVVNSKDHKINAINPVKDDIVKVNSPTFKDLYRAKILKTDKNGDFHVFYIDFGNTEVVQSSDIFVLADDLKMKEELAIKIGMKLPSNVKFNEKIKAVFLDLADAACELSIEFDETSDDGLQNCTLKAISSGLIINDEIIKLFDAESSLSSAENLESKMKESINYQEVGKIKPPKNGELVIITYFDNLNTIFVCKESEKSNFSGLTIRINREGEAKRKTHIKIGDVVKVPYESLMYRAEILDKIDEDHFQISFIDYGNKKNVDIDQIFEIPDEFKMIPGYCTKIGFNRSLPMEQLPIVKEYFNEFVESEESLIIEYAEGNSNGLNEASLKRENNIDVFDELCKIINKPSNIKEKLIPTSENSTQIKISSSNLNEIERISSIELKSGDIVFCSYFEDFDNLYLCKSSKMTTPHNCELVFDFSNKKDFTIKENPKYEEIVWVKFEEKIYRAKVLNKSKYDYTVFLMDIGKHINVSADNIIEIPDSLKQIPGLAKKAGLKGVPGLKMSEAIKDYFHKLWFDEPVPLIMMCDESNFNCLNEVNLKKLCDGCDIIDDLLEICGPSDNIPHKHITSAKSYDCNSGSNTITTPWLISSGDYVEFLNGNNIDNIFVRSKRMYDKYKNDLEKLKVVKRENLKSINARILNFNDIVAVYSSKYNGVFRAKLISKLSDENSKYSLIDFRYIDVIPTANVFELPVYALLKEIPAMTYKVTLTGLTKIINNNNIMSYLSSIAGKTFKIEFNKNAEPWYKSVVLKDLQSGESLNEKIQQLLTNNTSIISQQGRLERKIVANEPKKTETEKPCHPIKSSSHVLITHFENFNEIYIREASYEFLEQFQMFNVKMKKYFRTGSNKCAKDKVKVGDMVCVSTLLNQVDYCRALVYEINGRNECKVFNVDYGNIETVSSNEIFELPKEFEKLSYFACKIKLQNMPQVTTKNENQVIKDYFRKKIIGGNSHFIIEYDESNPNGLDNAILKTEYHKNDIANDIRTLLNAPPPLNIKTGPCQNKERQGPSYSPNSPIPARRTMKNKEY